MLELGSSKFCAQKRQLRNGSDYTSAKQSLHYSSRGGGSSSSKIGAKYLIASGKVVNMEVEGVDTDTVDSKNFMYDTDSNITSEHEIVR